MTTYIHSFSIAVGGIDYEAVPVEIEAEIVPGIGIHLDGLPDNFARESLLRAVTAMQAKSFRLPGKKIKIKIAPVRSRCSQMYDLPIALGIIAASGQGELPGLDDYIIAGELGLDGSVRDISGRYAVELARRTNKRCILPVKTVERMKELMLDDGVEIHGVSSLDEAVAILSREPRMVCPSCPKCGTRLVASDLPQYDYYCPECDEDFYNCEV